MLWQPTPCNPGVNRHEDELLTLVALAALTRCPPLPQRRAPAAAPAPDWAFTANLGLFSDYRFRGISQTDKKPALQGGFDIAHNSGLYIGNWNSNVDSAMYNGANLEMDFYGGYKATFDRIRSRPRRDLLLLPRFGDQRHADKIDNTELYIGGSYGPVSLKYNYAVTDFFGAQDSKGSSYIDLGFCYDVGKRLRRRRPLRLPVPEGRRERARDRRHLRQTTSPTGSSAAPTPSTAG